MRIVLSRLALALVVCCALVSCSRNATTASPDNDSQSTQTDQQKLDAEEPTTVGFFTLPDGTKVPVLVKGKVVILPKVGLESLIQISEGMRQHIQELDKALDKCHDRTES
jgi:hypothetical protein